MYSDDNFVDDVVKEKPECNSESSASSNDSGSSFSNNSTRSMSGSNNIAII